MRRSLLRLLVLGCLALASAAAGRADAPNVLIICADDLAAYMCGPYGSPTVRTPNLNAFAKTALQFERAFCNSPVCTASRQSFLTGRYPRTLGVTQLQTPLPEDEVTLAELFKAAGYDTLAIGKMHFNRPLLHGFDDHLDMDDHAQLLARVRLAAIDPSLVQPPWKPFRDPAAIWLNSAVKPWRLPDAVMPGTWFAEQAQAYLSQPRERPFFMMVSFYEPHSPFHFPPEFAGRHRPEAFSVPEVTPAELAQAPLLFRGLSQAEKQGINAAYATSVEFLDRNIGSVLTTLEDTGLAKNTIVVVMSDHGYMLAQHGRFEKHCSYEEAIRVPLWIKTPDSQPGRTAAMVELVDLAPTLLQACGLPVPSTVQGKSLLPVMQQPTAAHRTHVVVEYSENEEAAIRDERYKLVYITGNRARQDGYVTAHPLAGRDLRLFDLQHDPQEHNNLATDPGLQDRVRGLAEMLANHMTNTARVPLGLAADATPEQILDKALVPNDRQ